MNYGYNTGTRNWKEDRKMNLCFELAKVLKLTIGWVNAEVGHPYIEVDGGYDGVRIRRISHLSEKAHNKMITDADNVYEKVMK